jgi:hypothetical protein
MNFTQHHIELSSQAGAIPVKHDSEALADEFGDDENKYKEENTYRPRPQLPKPFVSMRNLASLISRLMEHST